MYGAFNLLIPAMLSDNFAWRLLCLHCEVSMIIHGAYNLLITTMLSDNFPGHLLFLSCEHCYIWGLQLVNNYNVI